MQITSTPAIAANAAKSSADLLAEAPSTPPMSVERLLPPTSISLQANSSQPFPTTTDDLPPIKASGSSLVQAENKLNARISLLVGGSELEAHCQLDSTRWRNSRDLPKRI
jgi:hypothetical protein